MVVGLDKFREFFAGLEDSYAVIGGSACDIIFNTAGIPFRATKDIEVLIVTLAGFATCFTVYVSFFTPKGNYRLLLQGRH